MYACIYMCVCFYLFIYLSEILWIGISFGLDSKWKIVRNNKSSVITSEVGLGYYGIQLHNSNGFHILLLPWAKIHISVFFGWFVVLKYILYLD